MFVSSFHDGPRFYRAPRRGDISPWGKVQHVSPLLPGITLVSTSSHGGMHVMPHKLEEMPPHLRSHDGWYEEDVEVIMPLVVFYDHLKDNITKSREDLLKEMKYWFHLEVD